MVTLDKTGFDNVADVANSTGMLDFANSVETAINDFLAGLDAATRIKLEDAITVQISGGVISVPSQALILLTSETGTSDTLDTIGVANNSYVWLKAAAGQVITLNGSGSGGITSLDGGNVVLSGNRMALAFCHNSQWSIPYATANTINNLSATADPGSGEDTGDGYGVGSMWVYPGIARAHVATRPAAGQAVWKRITQPRNRWRIRAAGATALGVGVANPTVANSPAASNQADNTFMTLPSTAVSGNLAGFVTTTFNLVRGALDPTIEIVIRTPSDISSLRYWIGLIDADLTAVDTLAAGREFIGWRYSTAVPDTGWRPVLHDGTTQNTGAAIGSVAADTTYRLKMRVVSSISTVYFSVNDGAEVAMTTNFPSSAQDLGAVCRVIPTSAAIRSLLYSSMEVSWG